MFRRHRRTQSKEHREIKLQDIVPLAEILLAHSFFHVARTQVFRQHRDASMGLQWAPILSVALMREATYFSIFSQAASQPHVAHRYVDNRLLLIPRQHLQSCAIATFWKLAFYSAPMLLETVQGYEVLGFNIGPRQSTITFVQPLRSVQISGTSQAIRSGVLARSRLILTNAFPHEIARSSDSRFSGIIGQY